MSELILQTFLSVRGERFLKRQRKKMYRIHERGLIFIF